MARGAMALSVQHAAKSLAQQFGNLKGCVCGRTAWLRSATRMQLARGLETGMLGINSLTVSMPEAPFGGVKESGWGSECGMEGLQAYCNTKLISED